MRSYGTFDTRLLEDWQRRPYLEPELSGMKKVTSKFEIQDKQSWKTLALSALKGQPFESIQCEIEPGLILDPLYVKAEIESFDPIFWPFNGSGWKIVESFVVTDNVNADEMNRTILKALEGGCEVLDIKIHPSIDLHPDILLKGVLLELITLRLELSSNQRSAFFNFIENYTVNNSIDRADLSIQIIDETVMLFEEMNNVDVYSVQLRKIIQAVEYYLLDRSDGKWENIIIKVPLGNHFIAEVSKIRALKLLIHGLAEKLSKPLIKYPTIHVQISPSQIKDELETLIERTSLATAAAFGGVDEICIAWDFDTEMKLTPADKRRVNRNIHWLLKKESQLSNESDALNGAYWIEYCTREFVNRTWTNIKAGGER